MRPILDLLKKRAPVNWSLSPQDTVFDALQTLANHNVGALMVLDNGKLVGVFSERDYTRKIALQGKSSKDTRDCLALMGQKKIRHLPVVDGDKVLGMISIRDIMDDIIADHELTINQLQHYISS